VSTHFHKNKVGNYLIQIADTLYQLNWQPEGVDITTLKNRPIEQILTKLKTRFSVSRLDEKLDPTQRLNTLLGYQDKDTVNLFVEDNKQTVSIHILDEMGNIISNHNLKLSQATALNHFQHFLTHVQKHKPNLTLRYFTLGPASNNTPPWKVSPLPTLALNERQGYLPVIITMASLKEDADCTISCGPKQFSGPANSKVIFEQIASFILSLRKSNLPYPLYINKINFLEPEKATTADYLLQKRRIEKQLNHD
jgi:adenylate cyclase class 1